MRCSFCGEPNPAHRWHYGNRFLGLCGVCEKISGNIVTIASGSQGAREVMVNQHEKDLRRKLLELRLHHITVYFSSALDIVALDIESIRERRMLKWTSAGTLNQYAFENVGHTYSNHDQFTFDRRFDFPALDADIVSSSGNLKPNILEALVNLRRRSLSTTN